MTVGVPVLVSKCAHKKMLLDLPKIQPAVIKVVLRITYRLVDKLNQ